MSRDKQMFNDLIEIFDEEYKRRNLITPQNTAEKMTAKGYCKIYDDNHKQVACYALGCQEGDKIARQVAAEIFAEIETSLMIDSFHGSEVYYAIRAEDFHHYKKKYTEGGK